MVLEAEDMIGSSQLLFREDEGSLGQQVGSGPRQGQVEGQLPAEVTWGEGAGLL